MKKIFITLLAAMMSTTLLAQLPKTAAAERIDRTQGQSVVPQVTAATRIADTHDNAARHSKSTGLYYNKPVGTLYQSYSDAGLGYPRTILAMPPFDAYTFINMSDNPTSCRWYVNTTDYTSRADSNGDFAWSITPGYYWYVPTVWNAALTQSFTIDGYNSSYTPYLVVEDDLEWMGFYDDKIPYWGSFLDNNNISGSGTYTDTNGLFGTPGVTYTSVGIMQICPAPASPLYCDEIYVSGVVSTVGGRPLASNVEQAMYIYDAETFELLATLWAGPDDYVYQYTDRRQGAQVDIGVLKYKNITTDPIFGNVTAPLVIDRAVQIEIYGFNSEYIDFGPGMLEAMDCDGDLTEGYIVFLDPETEEDVFAVSLTGSLRGNALGMYISFHGIMDMVQVTTQKTWTSGNSIVTIEGYNNLLLSSDGEVCVNDVDEKYDLGGLYVETCSPWYDTTGIENYSLAGLPAWITGVSIVEDGYDITNYTYYYILAVGAEPLPAGLSSREATVYIQGRGYTSPTPINIRQSGEFTGIDHISATAAATDGKTYNIGGQRVADDTKGIVIRDGKKYLNR